MEELDKLKQDWQKKENNFPKFSENEIYRMLHKKSSSIVKWILIISILEFAFWGLSTLISSAVNVEEYKAPKFLVILDYVNYTVLITFIILFYINYRKISAEKPVKELLQTIITVRRVVTFYVIYNICIIFFSLVCGLLMYEINDSSNNANSTAVIAIGIVMILIIIFIILLVYNVLYGRLVRKLNKNYVELEKIKQ
jgi:ABC-type multidrug transport system fused ATPase/permease subunit